MNPALLSLVLGTLGAMAGQLGSSFELWTEPEVLVVEHGGTLRLKLRSNCSGSHGSRGMETSNKKKVLSNEPGEMELELSNVTEGDSNHVYYTCNNERKKKDIQILIYHVPQRPELAKVPPLAVGETRALVCAVTGAAPTGKLRVMLRMGPDLLGTRTFEGHGQERLDRREVAEQVTVGLRHDGLNVTCEAQLDLSPFGPVINVTSEPLALRVCGVPKPQLNVTTRAPEEGTELSGLCQVPPEPCAEFRVRVWAGGRVLVGWGLSPLPFSLSVGEEHDGTELSCEAELARVAETPVSPRRSDPTRITVHVKPRLDELGCPPQQNWTEGREETLQCRARGNPRPLVECAKEGRRFPAGILTPVTREHAGIYHCRATNALGTDQRSVTVWVHYHDPDLLVPVLVGVLVVVSLLGAGLTYGIYYRRTKMREYRLREEQRRMEMGRPRPPGGSGEVAALNGAAPKHPQPGGDNGGAREPLTSPVP